MNSLIPCPACSRHVRAHEVACPFCQAMLGEIDRTAAAAVPARVRGRVSRIAAFAAGAALVSGAGACSTDKPTVDAGAGGQTVSGTGGAGGVSGTGGAGVGSPDAGQGGGAVQDGGQGGSTPVPIYAAAVALPRTIG